MQMVMVMRIEMVLRVQSRLTVDKDAQTVAQRQIQTQARVQQIRQQWKQRRLYHMAAAYNTHRESGRFGDGIKPFRTFNLTFLCIALRCVCARACVCSCS